ncbi:alpha,alpha-trehalase TreF, partial [Litchfieldella xinjiangensis]|uniref:alpha,alpha-trehalase TreF n=1 Tax=Litchfieldella xinjiangensis TaxID=1166948 RepID=UPI0005BE4DBA
MTRRTSPAVSLCMLLALGLLFASLASGNDRTAARNETPPPPDELWGDLFVEVQLRGIFEDSKTFVDLVPTEAPETVLEAFARQREKGALSDEALSRFVETYFREEDTGDADTPPDGLPITEHIDALWPMLTREPDSDTPRWSSRLPLPHAYVVPGGRFDEIYYWDSYFTLLGLLESGETQRVRDMVANFAHLIDHYGHIPNGNRTYYLTRSQPPFFAAMVNLLASLDGEDVYTNYLPALQAEYDYWMAGADELAPGSAHRRVVRLQDGALLNRYWDDTDTPRQESYREDVETAERTSRPKEQVWRDLRAGAESGWDFSSRWLADGERLATIRTTQIVPVDLNSLLVHLEETLAKAYQLEGNPKAAERYHRLAAQRSEAIRDILWSDSLEAFGDYLWASGEFTGVLSSASAFPLYFGIAHDEQAERLARTLEARLLAPGGLRTTQHRSGQQWDAPNGWAPQQWVAIQGLKRYGKEGLAETIATRWIATNLERFEEEHKLIEKYDVIDNERASGGEYPAQDGFGWTNAVLRRLLAMYPQAAE